MTYKHALMLHKVYINKNPNNETLDLFFNQQFKNRCPTLNFITLAKTSKPVQYRGQGAVRNDQDNRP